jgi:hypothetical protein
MSTLSRIWETSGVEIFNISLISPKLLFSAYRAKTARWVRVSFSA